MKGKVMMIDNGEAVIKGNRNNGDLFVLHFDTLQQPQEKALMVKSNIWLWYQRMVHTLTPKINSMIRHEAADRLLWKLDNVEDIFCEFCIYKKWKENFSSPDSLEIF